MWSEASFWWGNFKMFESWQPFSDSSILPLFEQAFQWVQKHIYGTFSSMWIIYFRVSWPLNLTNFARIPLARGGDVNQAWLDEMLALPPYTCVTWSVDTTLGVSFYIHASPNLIHSCVINKSSVFHNLFCIKTQKPIFSKVWSISKVKAKKLK